MPGRPGGPPRSPVRALRPLAVHELPGPGLLERLVGDPRVRVPADHDDRVRDRAQRVLEPVRGSASGGDPGPDPRRGRRPRPPWGLRAGHRQAPRLRGFSQARGFHRSVVWTTLLWVSKAHSLAGRARFVHPKVPPGAGDGRRGCPASAAGRGGGRGGGGGPPPPPPPAPPRTPPPLR